VACVEDCCTETGGKRPLGRPRNRWQDDNVMDFPSYRWEGMDWVNMAQDRDKG